MKLADWSLHFYRLPYARTIVWSNAVESSGSFALLKLTADNGAAGVAEGTIKSTWSGVSPRSLAAALEEVVLPQLKDADLADEAALASALARIPENRLAKGMVASACWTLRAAAAGQPLWKLWGGEPGVELSWTVTRQKPAAMAGEAAEYCARHGFRTLKVKGGQGLDTDLRALAEIRAAVGAGVELTVDANGAYGRAEAPEYVRRIAQAGVALAEDPSPLAPDAQFEALQQGSAIPILVDSSCSTARDAELYLARGARAISLKPGRVGLSETHAVQALAAKQGARLAVGIYAESALGTLISLQQAAAVPRARSLAAEQSFFLEMTAQVSRLVPEIRQGRVELPAAADMASLVDWDAVKRFAL
ncbi:MAG: hypothetical protein A3D95_02655 [Betaproteobacteria bacterium RIFCSPHIGHO2_12_FULL_69_13]|nr:MAG: hypothetical protein A3D95_02655 [Betaproteobacteria bacterium RIFCSPHIGHO2_12_FULL_69_13]OGA70276.1 MAG: hypothetical protein A3G83_05835 [Betaproteobacteria bacterium RIFCSPLOWO2_12_FULL_68_20]